MESKTKQPYINLVEAEEILKYYENKYKEEDENYRILKERILIQYKIYSRKPESQEKIKEYFQKKIDHYKNRYWNDKNFRIKVLLRKRFRTVINSYTKTGKIISSKKYGIDYQVIINYLQPLPKNLSNYHLHHIKPLSTFNFINKDGSQNLEEIRKAFAPKNHQLLLIDDHRKLNHHNLKD